ncbi:MAG: ABC transporter ATP-binding protein [Syntrophales bacterium]
MNDIVIQVENLGKLYRIGSAEDRDKTFREALVGMVAAPFRRIRNAFSRPVSNDLNPSEFIWALKDVNFEVKRGEIVGIIGRNGAGKSTLLKILSRITEPTEGRARIRGRIGSLLEVGTGFHSELTGEENIYLSGTILGMSSNEISRKFNEIVTFAEVEKFINTPVKYYSSGMYMRLAFAVAAHLEPEILLVDEVLAVGDASFQKKCLGKMGDVAKEGRTVLFVSHNMNMIASLCNKAIFLCEGNAKGPLSVMEGINLYLGQSGLNEIVFKAKPLNRAKVQQKGDIIEIVVEYELEKEIKMPVLGFIISDYFGNPICGSNLIDHPQEQLVNPTHKGVVKVIVEHPQLLNGTYRLSLWFGDGIENFFGDKDCMIFDVLNMVTKRQLPIDKVGPVFPKCRWYFQ